GRIYESRQSRIGVQRIIIHGDIYDTFRDMLVARTKALVAGDPKQRHTSIGPMIDVKEATRLEAWVNEAVAAGGTLLCGGSRNGAMFDATLLEAVPTHSKLVTEEAFGPVAVLSSFTDFSAALVEVNESRFGLQAGVFTR